MGERTIQTDPNHKTIGRFFKGGLGGHEWYCSSYDPAIGFWMEDVDEPGKRTNVSEAAIGRTWHRIHYHQDGAASSQWGYCRNAGKYHHMPVGTE